MQLEPAPLAGLQRAEDTDRVQLADGLLGQPAQPLGLGGPRPDGRQDGANGVQEGLWADHVIDGRRLIVDGGHSSLRSLVQPRPVARSRRRV